MLTDQSDGTYQCKCVTCREFFTGHKREVVCPACMKKRFDGVGDKMILLTEQEREAEKALKILYRYRGVIEKRDEAELLQIIDNLTTRAQKQYTEEELYEWVRECHPNYWHDMSGEYFQRGVFAFARFLGALKEVT